MASFRSRFVAWLVWVEVDRSHSIALQPAADGDDEFQVALADLVEIKLLFRMALVDADHQRAAAVKPRPHRRLIDLALDEEPVLKILDGRALLLLICHVRHSLVASCAGKSTRRLAIQSPRYMCSSTFFSTKRRW
jgi:hypothetical protein